MPEDHVDSTAAADEPDERTSPGGTIYVAETVRDFIWSALRHEAVSDDVTQLQVDFLQGKLDAAALAAKLRPLLEEAVAAATDADWSRITCDLIADAQELRQAGHDAPSDGAPEYAAVPA
jgi:hypothetical protein